MWYKLSTKGNRRKADTTNNAKTDSKLIIFDMLVDLSKDKLKFESE